MYIHLVLLVRLYKEIHITFCLQNVVERKYVEDFGMTGRMIWLVGMRCFILK
jgi:hypothetical protein